MLITAVRVPAADGLKVTIKEVLDPEAMVLLGAVVTLKSPAFTPEMVVAPKLKTPNPVLWIVKVRVMLVEPKSVKSPAAGVVSPSAIETALPRMSISG